MNNDFNLNFQLNQNIVQKQNVKQQQSFKQEQNIKQDRIDEFSKICIPKTAKIINKNNGASMREKYPQSYLNFIDKKCSYELKKFHRKIENKKLYK